MLRRYLSLAIPVMLSIAVALTLLHFRNVSAAKDRDGVQVAQADPLDPLAPKPKPPVVPPAPTKPKVGKKKAGREIPKKDEEVKTPFLKNLLSQLDGMNDATDEDRRSVRQMIYEADLELEDALGPNMKKRIEAANRKSGVAFAPEGPRQAFGPTIKRKDVEEGKKTPTPPKPMTPEKKPDPFKDDKSAKST